MPFNATTPFKILFSSTETSGWLLASCAARQRDAAGEPVLSKKEVATLWRELFAAMAIAGLSPQKLGEAEILEIIKAAWKQMTAAAAEAGGDAAKDEVTLQELKDWCQTDLGRRGMLTKMFSGNVRGTVAQMAIAEYKKRGTLTYDEMMRDVD